MPASLTFDDETIHQLFGHEAADNEPIEKLMSYYLKNDVFSRVTAKLPLRILVGHKGIGKSALFYVAREHDKQDGIISILLKNNDIAEAENSSSFNEKINSYKVILLKKIYEKVIDEYCNSSSETKDFEWLKMHGRNIIGVLEDFFKPLLANKASSDGLKSDFIKNFLDKSKIIVVYIDDLDRGWSASREAVSQLSALINALRDLSSENKGLYFRIALRSDVYYLVRTSDESTDKIESSVVWHSWKNHEILALLAKRVEAYFGTDIDDVSLASESQSSLAKRLERVIDPIYHGKGKWEELPTYKMLMTLIRRRPRDLIKLCTLAAQQAYRRKGNKINSNDFSAIFDSYSQSRLQDTINEYSSELNNIRSLLLMMKTSKNDEHIAQNLYTTGQLNKKVGKIIGATDLRFFHTQIAPSASEISAFLYKIGFFDPPPEKYAIEKLVFLT